MEYTPACVGWSMEIITILSQILLKLGLSDADADDSHSSRS